MVNDPATPDLTVTFYSRALARDSGVSRAGLDVLLAVSRAAREVRVCSWGPKLQPPLLDGLAFGRLHFESVPLQRTLRAWLARDAPVAALAHSALALGTRAQPCATAIELVNGFGAHRLAEYARSKQRAQVRALIVHESPRHFEAYPRMSLTTALAVLRSYDHRIYVSERGQREWDALAQLPAASSHYIPNCVGETRVQAVRAKDRAVLAKTLDYRADQLRVVCVGTVSERKGQDVLLDASARVLAKLPQLHLDLIGPAENAFAQALEQRARTLGFGARLRWLGKRADVFERVYAADLLILPSRSEAFPLATLEAMALGTCVLASNVDGVPEQILDGRTGLLFPCEDASALAERLVELAEDPTRRAELAAAGNARYWSEFARALQLERWSTVLQQLCAR